MCNLPETTLSIIIPVLNEEHAIPPLFENLERQGCPGVEVIICDGGSSDGTVPAVRTLAPGMPWPVRILTSEAGRGRQMNAGAACAKGSVLLFLHADSAFEAPSSLADSLNSLLSLPPEKRAARFSLKFTGDDLRNAAAYHYHESKARLARPGCVLGDQGMMLGKELFRRLGGFPELLPYLEDMIMSQKLEKHTAWQLLPHRILTSARRFEHEGVKQRRDLNLVICVCHAASRYDFLARLPEIYRSSPEKGRTPIGRILTELAGLIDSMKDGERELFWKQVGAYAAANSWQLFFMIDAKRAFRRGLAPGEFATPVTGFHDRFLAPFFSSAAGTFLGILVFKTWFGFKRRMSLSEKP